MHQIKLVDLWKNVHILCGLCVINQGSLSSHVRRDGFNLSLVCANLSPSFSDAVGCCRGERVVTGVSRIL